MDIDILSKIEKTARESIKIVPNDYFINEIWYCGDCHTPKECLIDTGDGAMRKFPIACKCRTEKYEREKAEREREEHDRKIRHLRSMGFPDEETAKCTFDKDDGINEKLSSIAKNYVKNFPAMYKQGKGLLFYGAVGTGKTFISACIANALIDDGYACLVTNFARLVNTISGLKENSQAYIDGLDRFSLLVLDDLASERDTEYMNETVLNIIDARYRSGKPLIVTTNLTADELKHPAEMRKQRIYSRLFEMCIPVEVSGKDRRKEKLKKDFDEMKELLGL